MNESIAVTRLGIEGFHLSTNLVLRALQRASMS